MEIRNIVGHGSAESVTGQRIVVAPCLTLKNSVSSTAALLARAGSRRDFEAQARERILESLRGARWNVSIVARSLGIPRNTLYRRLARYGSPGSSLDVPAR